MSNSDGSWCTFKWPCCRCTRTRKNQSQAGIFSPSPLLVDTTLLLGDTKQQNFSLLPSLAYDPHLNSVKTELKKISQLFCQYAQKNHSNCEKQHNSAFYTPRPSFEEQTKPAADQSDPVMRPRWRPLFLLSRSASRCQFNNKT